MVLSTLGVAADVTPSVIETFFSHYLHRKQLRQKPTAHISYHEGLRLIRQFLSYASEHTVEDVQAFTGQWVPCPTWVAMEELLIPDNFLAQAASLIQTELGPHGIGQVGGTEWWQWRRPEIPLKAERIEMKADLNERKASGKEKSERIILYVHGGAYYFGSTGEHRYQMQRHARKLKAQLLAPKYRLAPQFPFPCGLHDCIATYLYLIQDHHPSTILLGGDSAGGGMVLSMLVILRDQGIPLPAGAILLSPWCDLTHSFPSVAGNGDFDYIPANGFHHKPSMVWPPPNAADMESLETDLHPEKVAPSADETDAARASSIPKAKPNQVLSIELDGKLIEIQDQIQMYAANHLLAHPLVSPVMQPSLGGLPPLLIQVGGGELLKDEQIYIAHKAANPSLYPPPDSVLDQYDPHRRYLNKFEPTRVQLQVWDDLCHVPHTLSFTRPAKFMYRSVAQFGAWALAHAQKKAIAIMDDDDVSVISSDDSEGTRTPPRDPGEAEGSHSAPATQHGTDGSVPELKASNVAMRAHTITTATGEVGRAGDPIPYFVDHMIRQRVDRHGIIYPLPPASELPALHVDPTTIGVIKPGPVRKWIAKKSDWDFRYAKEKRHVQKTRLKEMRQGYDGFQGETPPPTALAGRIQSGMEKEKLRKGKSWGLAMWSGWGSKHDQSTIDRKKKITRQPTQSVVLPEAGQSVGATENPAEPIDSEENQQKPASTLATNGEGSSRSANAEMAGVGAGVLAEQDQTKVEGSENTYLSANNARPHNGVIAYPFKLRNMPDASVSTATLDSSKDHVRPMGGIHGTYQSSLAGDENSVQTGNSEKHMSGSGTDGANEGDIGSHAWIVGGVKRDTPRSGPQVNHDAQSKPVVVTSNGHEDGGHEIGGHNWIIGGGQKEKTQKNEQVQQINGTHNARNVSGSKDLAANGTTREEDKSGHEVGGHNWIVGGEQKQSPRPNEEIRQTSGTHGSSNGTGPKDLVANGPSREEDETGHEIGGHNWIVNGGKGKAQTGSTADPAAEKTRKVSERPPAQTFVTAREDF